MNFVVGGMWLYYMLSTEGDKMYAKADYLVIEKGKSYQATETFCDEQGNDNGQFPGMKWNVDFNSLGVSTRVDIEITFSSIENMEKIIEMGFKEGFTMAHGNLDRLLAK